MGGERSRSLSWVGRLGSVGDEDRIARDLHDMIRTIQFTRNSWHNTIRTNQTVPTGPHNIICTMQLADDNPVGASCMSSLTYFITREIQEKSTL